MNSSIIIVISIPAAVALVLIVLWIARKKKLAGIKENICRGDFPASKKEQEAYEHFASHSSEEDIRTEATRLLFGYYCSNHSGHREMIEKAVYYGEKIKREYSNRDFFDDCMFELANLYFFEQFNFEKAAEIFKELLDKKPSSRWRMVCETRIKLINNNLSNKEALKLYASAEKFFENSRFKDAEGYLRKILEEYSQLDLAGASLFFLGDMYYYKYNDHTGALSYYRKVYEKFPSHSSAPKAVYKAGEILRKKEKWEEAVKLYRKFTKTYQESPYRDDAYFYIGECYQNLDMPRNAKNAYSLILGDYPDSKWTDVIYHRVQELNKIIGMA